jgi:hypothetical protein
MLGPQKNSELTGNPHRPSHTRIGKMKFTEGGFAGGYPTLKTVDMLFA